MSILLALLSALIVGVVTWLVLGPVIAVVVAVVIITAGVVGHRQRGGVRTGIAGVLLVASLAAGMFGALQAISLLEALRTTEGAVDAADPDALARADAKLGSLDDSSAFRLELTEPELQAIAQEGLAGRGDTPIRRVDVNLRGAQQDLEFTATFKSDPSLQARGTATIQVVDGGVDVTLGQLDFGRLQVPRLASNSVEQLLGAVTDLNQALAQQRASVQAVQITEDLLIVTGTKATDDVLTNTDLLDAILAQAGSALAVTAPPEVVGRGVEASRDAPGTPMVLAIGDSLAANVGVDDARDGYVSRVHGALERRDGVDYGLLNLGVPGETSGTLLSSGQLVRAEEALGTRQAAYVLIDIGANDLLGHLTSADCSDDLRSPGCQARIDQTLGAYRRNLATALDRVQSSAGDAQIVFLQAYNPFSLGVGESDQERESNAILSQLNAVAAEEAARRDIRVADGYTPMQKTTAATTHMLDADPDIHPNAAGYDVLAAAIMSRL